MQAEPDLEKRLTILEDALRRFPSEPRLERLWGLTREKRNLVNSILGLARLYEQGRQYSEALGQWQTLQIIHSAYPGLDSEISRVEKLRAETEDRKAVDYGDDNIAGGLQTDNTLAADGFEASRHSWDEPEENRERLEEEFSAYPADYENEQPSLPKDELSQPAQLRIRRQHMAELARLEAESETTGDPSILKEIHDRVESIAREYSGDREFQQPLTRAHRWLAEATKRLKNERWAQAQESTAQARPTDRNWDRDSTSPKPADFKIPGHPDDSPSPDRPKPNIWNQHLDWVFAGASTLVMVTLATIFGIVHARHHRNVAVRNVTVEINTSPVGAAIRLNKEDRGTSPLRFELPEGTYQLEAMLDGYQPFSETFSAKGTSSGPIDITLEPLATTMRLLTDLDSGRVLLDTKDVGELRQGQFVLDGVEAGSHDLKILGGPGEVIANFQNAPGEMPTLRNLVTSKELRACAVTSWGGRAKVYCSSVPVKLAVDGQPQGEVSSAGLEVNNVGRGSHELMLGQGQTSQRRTVEIGSAPGLVIFLNSERNVGTLVVLAGEDDAHVSVNGKDSGSTRGGRLRIPNLPVKEYTVQVEKPGFETEPPQVVRLKKGEDTAIEFKMRAIPAAASLLMDGAPAGAGVFLDDKPFGIVKPDGTFSSSNVKPGGHFVGLQLQGYKPVRLWKNFAAGAGVRLGREESALELISGRLIVYAVPRTSRLTLRGVGESSSRMIKVGEPISLPPGAYTVTAHWDDGDERTETVQILADKDKFVSLEAHPAGMEDWENPARWVHDGTWSVHYGGGFVLLHKTPLVGRVDFTANLRKGRHLQWVVGLTDDSNYILYQMDDKSFQRISVLNGKRSLETKSRQGMGKSRLCTLRIEIKPNSIVQQLFVNGAWTALDTRSDPRRNVGDGKFGFVVDSDEVVALANFSFQPQ